MILEESAFKMVGKKWMLPFPQAAQEDLAIIDRQIFF